MTKSTKVIRRFASRDRDSERLINVFKKGNICLSFNDKAKKFSLDEYTIYYSSKSSAIQTLEEVFINMPYYFRTNKINPFIIDAGSEVGISTIFFKMFYPKSKILCFEPHPNAFSLLIKNIKANKLDDVTAINIALTYKNGTVDFFGEFDSSVDLDTRGSSVVAEWGLQRDTSSMIQVKSEKLSKYIKRRVDFLKLNVEGAEQQILEDLEKKNKLKLVENLLVKFHHSQKTQNVNNLERVYDLLSKNDIIITKKIQKNPKQIFPNITKNWAIENQVFLYTLFAKKANNQIANKLKENIGELRERILSLKMSFIEKEFFMLRNAIDNVPSSIYWKDRDGNYLGHSAYAVQQLHNTNIAPDATMKNVIGKTDYDIFAKDIADKYRENDLYVIKNKKDLVLEEKITTPDGKKLTQLSSKKPLYDESGNVVGIIGSTIDITERKQAETLEVETKLYKNQLQEQKKFKRVAEQVAHDIRSPLTSLSIITESCKDIPEEDRITLKKTASNINDIANNLLNRYRQHDDKMQVGAQKSRDTLVFLALSEILSEKRYQYKSSKIRFNLSCDKVGKFESIKIDPLNFNRMISNLINNSVEAIKSKAGVVDLELKPDDRQIKITVKDNGKGMSSKIISKIMNNIPVTSGKKDGIGIGFAQVRGNLQENNGKMSIKSKVGEGAEVTLRFPRTKTPDWLVRQINLQKDNLVIVLDDDPSIHKVWDVKLKPHDSKIRWRHFKSGKDVISFIGKLTPEGKNKIFLLSDFELINQELNGLQIILYLNMQNRSILVTNHHDNEKVRAVDAKMGIKIIPKQLVVDVAVNIEDMRNEKRT